VVAEQGSEIVSCSTGTLGSKGINAKEVKSAKTAENTTTATNRDRQLPKKLLPDGFSFRITSTVSNN